MQSSVSTAVPQPQRGAALCGLLGVALNVVAVVALRPIPHTYKPSTVATWLAETVSAPIATTVSACAFTIGLAAFVPFAVGLARRDAGTSTGAALIAAGALLDAAGTMAPIAALHVERAVGEGMLWTTLLLDSAFNGLLGAGLVATAFGMRAEGQWPRGMRPLALLAGLVSLPVSLQFSSDTFANLLVVAAPLWIGWVLWTSLVMLKPVKARA